MEGGSGERGPKGTKLPSGRVPQDWPGHGGEQTRPAGPASPAVGQAPREADRGGSAWEGATPAGSPPQPPPQSPGSGADCRAQPCFPVQRAERMGQCPGGRTKRHTHWTLKQQTCLLSSPGVGSPKTRCGWAGCLPRALPPLVGPAGLRRPWLMAASLHLCPMLTRPTPSACAWVQISLLLQGHLPPWCPP